MPDQYRMLRDKHGYNKASYDNNHCHNCSCYKQNIELAPDVVADICIVDIDPWDEDVIKAHIIHQPFGVCDEHDNYQQR